MIFVGILLILIGLSALTGISFLNFLFAIILIVIGVRLVMGRSWAGPGIWHWHDHGDDHHRHRRTSIDDYIDEVVVFSPLDKSYTSERFKGGKIVMVFSGGEIDLTGVKTDAMEIYLEVSSVFSNIEITVPRDWKVRSNVAVFLGNVDTHDAQGGDGSVTLTVRGESIFGNVEVRK